MRRGSSKSSVTSVSVDKKIINVVSDSNLEKTEKINVTINNVPDEGLFYGIAVEKEDYSITFANFYQTSDTKGVIEIQFASGFSLGEGTYLNQVGLVICLDTECVNQIEGSPVVIDTSLESLPGSAQVVVDGDSISVEGNSAEKVTPVPSVISLTVSDYNLQDLFVNAVEVDDENDISYISHSIRSNKVELKFDYTNAEYLKAGSHSATFRVDICYDFSCRSPVDGSPFEFDVEYNVNRFPSETTLINPTARTELNHDVIDAEYSSQLNSIVIASSLPRNSVYIYDLDDISNVNEIALSLTPTSVSVLNAGNSNKIVIGHDAKITYLDFNAANSAISVKKLLDVPVDVFDLVATDQAVYAVLNGYQSGELQRIDISDNTITSSGYPPIYGRSKIKLHPNLKSTYLADNGLSPSDIEKINIQTIPPSSPTDSPYHGDYSMCGDLWISNDGNRIYTACGNTFRSSDTESQDMIYTGRLPLISDSIYGGYNMASITESNSKNEVAVVEFQPNEICNETGEIDTCIYTLSIFSKDFLNRISALAFDRVTVSGDEYYEKPAFTFYNKAGDSVFVVSSLLGIPTQRSYILEIQR